MSHLSKIFEEAPIKVQNKNGFDLSHVHSGTSKAGQLVPVLTKLLPPNTTVSLGVNAEVNLPPLVAPFYGKVDFAIEGFVVPCSILYGGWKQFISNQEINQFPDSQSSIPTSGDFIVDGKNTTGLGYSGWNQRKGYDLPYFDLYQGRVSNLGDFYGLFLKNDNIYAYMGCNPGLYSGVPAAGVEFRVSLMPALAYHKICDVFYRNTKLTKTWFSVNPVVQQVSSNTTTADSTIMKNVSLIWHSFLSASPGVVDHSPLSINSSIWGYGSPNFDTTASLTFPDSISVFSTRQRTYMRDYFTSAVPSPQQGGSAQLQFDTSTSTSEFTVNALKASCALQHFLETNNLSGDYSDIMRNRWGIRPIDADFEEPHYLGRVVIPVYQHTIYKQDSMANDSPVVGENPWTRDGALGAQAGVAKANGEGSICNNFNISCWSYLMCIASLYPHANYNYGINKELTMLSLGDFPAPELQTIGMEEIKNYEIQQLSNYNTHKGTWGYIPRYSFFKYVNDHSSGELMPGKSLEYFQLQRNFGFSTASGYTPPVLGTDFVTIAQNALDGVLTVNTELQNFTCWWEIYFEFKVSMPLSDFIIPTLGELGDTHTIKTTVGGSRL